MQNRKTTFMAFVAVLLTIGALWFTNRAVTPTQATWDDVLAEGKNGGYGIITTEALSERYQKDAGSLLLVDTRQEWEYRTGHLKGAVNFLRSIRTMNTSNWSCLLHRPSWLLMRSWSKAPVFHRIKWKRLSADAWEYPSRRRMGF